MAHIHADGVADTTTTTGTGSLTVDNAAPTGFRTFNDAMATSDTCFYFIRHRTSQEWEAGLGTYSGSHVLARTTVISSSNANAAVTLTAGTKDVFISSISQRDNPRLHGVPTDERLARFDGTTGNLQTSLIGVTDAGAVTGAITLDIGDPDTTLSRSAAGELAVEGVLVKKVGKETIWLPPSAFVARASSPAGSSTYDSGSNDVTIFAWDFDTTSAEYIHSIPMGMPKSWNESTVTAQILHTNTGGSSTQTVRWTVAGIAFSDDDTLNAARGTAVNLDDTWLAQNDLHKTAESSAITIGGTPAEGDMIVFEIGRDVANDNMTGDVRFLGMYIFITSNASTDA